MGSVLGYPLPTPAPVLGTGGGPLGVGFGVGVGTTHLAMVNEPLKISFVLSINWYVYAPPSSGPYEPDGVVSPAADTTMFGMPAANSVKLSLLSAPLHEIAPPSAVESTEHTVTTTTGGVSHERSAFGSQPVGVGEGDAVGVVSGVGVLQGF